MGILERYGPSGGSNLSGPMGRYMRKTRGGTRGRTPTPQELQAQVESLRARQEELGAPGIEQDKPGIFRTIVDVLSRPNYAIAGFAEELAKDRSVTGGVTRALAEIFSGVGGIQGEKRAFGEVLEDLGVGTKTLADAFPALEGTWIGAMGSRGAAGIALDIATDPLTYMTFGTGSGMRIATSKGVRVLNKSGTSRFTELMRRNLDEIPLRAADDVEKSRRYTKALTKTEQQFEELYSAGEDITGDFLEKGGAKLFGAQIPGSDKLGVPLKKALSMLPDSVVKPAVEGAQTMASGMRRTLNGLFAPEGALANLPQPIRERAVRLTNDFFRSSTAHRTRLMHELEPLEAAYRKLEKADPSIGERWHKVREQIPGSQITDPAERELYERTMALYDQMGETALAHGLLSEEQIIENYIFHQYKNIEDLSTYHPRTTSSRSAPGKARFEKERVFADLELAKEESKRLRRLALQLMPEGEARKLYPELIPEYDVFKNMKTYVNSHADALARKAWREEMVGTFGKQLDELIDPDGLYDAGLSGVRRAEDFVPERVPLRRVIEEGDPEPLLESVFGKEGAQYVAVKSKLTSDELVYLPKAISDAMESVNSSLFNTKEYKEFGKLLRGFDWLNNNFKWGVYTVWPASAARDAYSNIALSGLRIGWSALDPRSHARAVKLMLGKHATEEFANSGYTYGQLREMAKTFGVWVPGSVFVEQTGRFKLGKFRKVLTEKRAGIENEARVLLWLDEIKNGVDPRIAADTVGRFLFNYGEVSKAEREVFRRLIPFYTFTRKNVEMQAKALKHTPGRVINQIKPFRGQPDENDQMVQWEAEALKLRMDRDGKTVHMLTGIDLPLRNLDTLWRGDSLRTGRSLMGMVTPVLKTVPEILLDRDFFLGRELTRTQSGAVGRLLDNRITPKPIKDWLGYKKETDEAGRPRYSFDGKRFTLLFRSWMFSRAVSTSDRQFREYAKEGGFAWQSATLDMLTGLRYKELDMDEQMLRKVSNRVRQLERSLQRRGALTPYKKLYAPKRDATAEFD